MLRKRASRGERTPAIDDAPLLFEDLQPFWDAWNELHRSRPVGWGPCPLPVADIAAYVSLQGIDDPDLKAEYFKMISALDAAWLGWARQREEADRKSKKKKKER